jgi:serine/threonine protein kinase
LHRNRIIHRDIKPENILLKTKVENEYILKMADFGLACYSDSTNQVDNLAGTPMYMGIMILTSPRNSSQAWI